MSCHHTIPISYHIYNVSMRKSLFIYDDDAWINHQWTIVRSSINCHATSSRILLYHIIIIVVIISPSFIVLCVLICVRWHLFLWIYSWLRDAVRIHRPCMHTRAYYQLIVSSCGAGCYRHYHYHIISYNHADMVPHSCISLVLTIVIPYHIINYHCYHRIFVWPLSVNPCPCLSIHPSVIISIFINYYTTRTVDKSYLSYAICHIPYAWPWLRGSRYWLFVWTSGSVHFPTTYIPTIYHNIYHSQATCIYPTKPFVMLYHHIATPYSIHTYMRPYFRSIATVG